MPRARVLRASRPGPCHPLALPQRAKQKWSRLGYTEDQPPLKDPPLNRFNPRTGVAHEGGRGFDSSGDDGVLRPAA
jgi:hypothetical protein